MVPFGRAKKGPFLDDKSFVVRKRSELVPEAVLGGKYVLKTPAGRGGMGEVWRAWDLVGKRFVALKFISADVKRLTRETRRTQEAFHTVGELHHQNICPSYGLEFDKKYGLYLAMKWLGGYSLDKVIDHNKRKLGRFPRRAIPELLKPVASALDYSHGKGVVHRDVKPSNIFLEVRNRKIADVYLIDFGLSEMIRENSDMGVGGTFLYMAPEQWLGAAQNGKTDQYSLAAIAYELYSGAPPFARSSVETLRSFVLHEQPDPIRSLPDVVNATLQRGLAKKMKDRFDTCGDFVRALEEAASAIDYDPTETSEVFVPMKKLQADGAVEVESVPQIKRDEDSSFGWSESSTRSSELEDASQTERFRLVYLVAAVLIMLATLFGLAIASMKLIRSFTES